jgi:hypothetical protein
MSEWARAAVGGVEVHTFDPPGARPACVLYLHSLAEEAPATDPAFTALLREHRLRCAAPRGGWCWWTGRTCTEFPSPLAPEAFILSELVPWLAARYALPPRAIALAGTEMGGHGAVRLALRHPEHFPTAASLSGAMDMHEWYGRGTPLDAMYESRERARLDTAVLHVGEREWPRHLWFACGEAEFAHRGNDRLHEKLNAMGVPHVAELRATGSQTGPMLAFVSAALAQEARRLM